VRVARRVRRAAWGNEPRAIWHRALGRLNQLDAVAASSWAGSPLPRRWWPGSTSTRWSTSTSAIIEVHGYAKAGSGYGYSGIRGLNALLATVTTKDAAPVIVTQRLRKGSCGSPRGAKRLVADRAAGYRYDLSILQAEFSLTQMLDKPVTGRLFFEQVIRDNLDLGRPEQVSLIFGRRIHRGPKRATPGRFRTRVITAGSPPACTPSTSTPRSSSTTRKDERCEPRPPSTTPATSTSGNG